MRNVVVWVSLSLLVYACFAPWAEVTTFHGETLMVNSMGEYTGGGQFVLLCAGAAAIATAMLTISFVTLLLINSIQALGRRRFQGA